MREIAAALIDLLKGMQPATLALTVANLSLLAFMFYALSGAAQTRDKLVSQLTDNAGAIHEILSRCTLAPTP
jgi:hypothetical protein